MLHTAGAMFRKILIANRGEIACRIERTAHRLGVASVAIYSDPDRYAAHALLATESWRVGPAPVPESYLNVDAILAAAAASGAEAIHPGYGFLSENADFAERCARQGLVFIGPTPAQIRLFGLKHTARALAQETGVPLLPGSGILEGVAAALEAAGAIGYPVMLKSTAGGGGIGMRICHNPSEIRQAYDSVSGLARTHFRDGGLYVEKYVQAARHVEVQIFGDGRGLVVHLGERDCSVQRRHQKVIEETPAPGLAEQTRARLCETAVALMRAARYQSAGTVEFIVDARTGAFYFLEVNTRLQVEHGITEAVTGVDLVEWMIRGACGDLDLGQYRHAPQGHAIEVRLYAEDPHKGFRPASGLVTEVHFPAGIRVDTWLERGTVVSPFYDPLLAKLITHAPDRPAALARLGEALADTRVSGLETNLAYLQQVLQDPVIQEGRQETACLEQFRYRPHTVDVTDGGIQTSIQDYPGRVGYWGVGVPPSGPMDDLAFRTGNRLLGNPEHCAGLECTVRGPTLVFNCATTIALTGAAMEADLDGRRLACWQAYEVAAGSVLRLGGITGPGARTYLAIAGGFDVPPYLGSRATFALGQFGGHAGRLLRAGDVLHLAAEPTGPMHPLPAADRPSYDTCWDIGVLYGPHGAPDFFTCEDIDTLFATAWEVHYHSSRTGVRLIGPKPHWARTDGGEAGLHPSNIHDNAYAIGAIDFTGDMPVILGPDGPSLGGFVCPATVAAAERWKLGQLRPGDRVRFHRLTQADAMQRERAQDARLRGVAPGAGAGPDLSGLAPGPVLGEVAIPDAPPVVFRQAGDKYLLIEYGAPVLDLRLRFRVHALMCWLEAKAHPAILDLTPGVRSLQIHYDNQRLPLPALLELVEAAVHGVARTEDVSVPTRLVRMPLAWDDHETRRAIDRYMQSVRPDAPWCPSNIEFIRRINGLADERAVREIVFQARYLVMGLGDVYLGAPVATPLDPRHRLVTTKYNPARTWTPENAVGIGGAYLCIYGMEGPGGYQFVGRTLPVWNRYRETGAFAPGKPWLLRFFDQIQFYPVSEEELLQQREDFTHGRLELAIEEGVLRLDEYQAFLDQHAAEISAFKARQQQAFEAERRRWAEGAAHGSAEVAALPEPAPAADEPPPGHRAVIAEVTGTVWKLLVAAGQRVEAMTPVAVIESMKMEITAHAGVSGTIQALATAEGRPVTAGEPLVFLKPLGEES